MFLSQAGRAQWLTDFDQATTTAKSANKPMLINFTGSDWCGWCIRLKDEVFSQPEFTAYASENLILVEIDFPRRNALPAAQAQANRKLADRFGVSGFPTLYVVSASGQTLGKLGYMPGGPKAFIKQLDKYTGAGTSKGTASAKKAPTRPPINPATPPKPVVQDGPKDLELNGLSGTGAKRFAIINHQTFAAGETATVKMGKTPVRLKCLEIREESVLVKVDGQAKPQELFLSRF